MSDTRFIYHRHCIASVANYNAIFVSKTFYDSESEEFYVLLRLKVSDFKRRAEIDQVLLPLNPNKLKKIANYRSAEIIGF